MMKIDEHTGHKTFRASNEESLDKQMNQWIEEHQGAEIINISYTDIQNGSIFAYVLYKHAIIKSFEDLH